MKTRTLISLIWDYSWVQNMGVGINMVDCLKIINRGQINILSEVSRKKTVLKVKETKYAFLISIFKANIPYQLKNKPKYLGK